MDRWLFRMPERAQPREIFFPFLPAPPWIFGERTQLQNQRPHAIQTSRRRPTRYGTTRFRYAALPLPLLLLELLLLSFGLRFRTWSLTKALFALRRAGKGRARRIRQRILTLLPRRRARRRRAARWHHRRANLDCGNARSRLCIAVDQFHVAQDTGGVKEPKCVKT